jgi:hypothetical protein
VVIGFEWRCFGYGMLNNDIAEYEIMQVLDVKTDFAFKKAFGSEQLVRNMIFVPTYLTSFRMALPRFLANLFKFLPLA